MQTLHAFGAFQKAQRWQFKAGMRVFKGQCGLRFDLRLLGRLHDPPDWLLHHFARLGHGDFHRFGCRRLLQGQRFGGDGIFVRLVHRLLHHRLFGHQLRCRLRLNLRPAQQRLGAQCSSACGQRRLGAQGGGLAGVQQQRVRSTASAFGQRRSCWRVDRIGIADAVLDHIGDLAFDALLTRCLVDDGVAIGLDQLELGHAGFGAFDKARHPSKHAARLCFQIGHRGLLRVVILTCVRRGPSVGFLSLLAAALTALGLTGRQVLRGHNGTAGAPAQKGHQPGIGHDQANQQEPRDAHQLSLGEAQHKSAQGQNRHAHQKRHQLDRQGRTNRQDRQKRAHDSIAKETAQTEAMG